MKTNAPNFNNIFIAMLLSLLVITLWQYFYITPRSEAIKAMAEQDQKLAQQGIYKPESPEAQKKTRTELIAGSARLKLSSPSLHGTVGLQGGRIDDLTLAKYKVTLDKNSADEILLSPAGVDAVYFVEFGWVAADKNVAVPDANTMWSSDRTELSPASPVTMSWDNGKGLLFQIIIALDDDYMFTVRQKVVNSSGVTVNLFPYAFLNRAYTQTHAANLYLHEGPLGVMKGSLEEIDYEDLREEGKQVFENASGWIGVTDKYWLTALIPDAGQSFKAEFSSYKTKDGHDRYQAELVGQAKTLASGETSENIVRLFAGAKELKLLDAYAAKYNIPLFDRAVDLGVLYFITKPIFLALNLFYGWLGNFGLAILLLTVLIKLALFPLANKSYRAMNDMKRLQPELLKLRERHLDDKMKLNQEMMALYKREKVNPAAGCLPILIQIPIFIALYKVLFVTIEMRHAPFFGWIKDLSAPDPTHLLNLFGLIPWQPPGLLHIGAWPFIMFVTMIIQQKLNPKPADPVQAKMITWMPYIFVFLFASAPAGLVIYWAWSNTLSILQQWLIMHRAGDLQQRKKKAA